MTGRVGTHLPLLVGVFAALCAPPALARASSCPRLAIEADASVSARWPGLVGELRRAFDARNDIERCARVELSSQGSSVFVQVTLPDGRSATREVLHRDDVVPALEGLLLLPQPPTPSHPSAAPAAPATSPPARSRPFTAALRAGAPSSAVAVDDQGAPAHSSRTRSSSLGIELDVATGARVGDGQMGVGLGALSFLDLSGWLMGFEGRADRYRQLGGAFDDGTLELGVLGGRRFWVHGAALDVIAGPAAALEETGRVEAQARVQSSRSTLPRLLAGARMSFNAHSTVRAFVGIDAEVGPAGGDGTVPGESRLPRWTLGLELGAAVGTR